MTNSWTVTLEEDENGDVILPLNEEFMKEQGWLEGDIISWDVIEGGAVMTNITAKERKDNGLVDSDK